MPWIPYALDDVGNQIWLNTDTGKSIQSEVNPGGGSDTDPKWWEHAPHRAVGGTYGQVLNPTTNQWEDLGMVPGNPSGSPLLDSGNPSAQALMPQSAAQSLGYPGWTNSMPQPYSGNDFGTTLGNLILGGATSAVTGGIGGMGGLGQLLAGATGLSAPVAAALTNAGVSGITGGNPLMGLLTSAAGSALQGGFGTSTLADTGMSSPTLMAGDATGIGAVPGGGSLNIDPGTGLPVDAGGFTPAPPADDWLNQLLNGGAPAAPATPTVGTSPGGTGFNFGPALPLAAAGLGAAALGSPADGSSNYSFSPNDLSSQVNPQTGQNYTDMLNMASGMPSTLPNTPDNQLIPGAQIDLGNSGNLTVPGATGLSADLASFLKTAPPGIMDQIKSLLGAAGGVLGTGLGTGGATVGSTLPGLLALAYAAKQPGVDTSQLNNILGQTQGNESAIIKAATDPFQRNIAAGYGDLLQSQGLRGIRGSSFGDTDIANYLSSTGGALANAGSNAAQGSLALQGNLASQIAQLNAQNQTTKNNLYGTAFNVLGRGLNPTAYSGLGNIPSLG